MNRVNQDSYTIGDPILGFTAWHDNGKLIPQAIGALRARHTEERKDLR